MFVYNLTSGDWYERHAAAAPSATQIDNSLSGRPIVMPTNCDSARARAELTIYLPLAFDRLSDKQRPRITHRCDTATGRDRNALPTDR